MTIAQRQTSFTPDRLNDVVEAEQAVIGAILRDNAAHPRIAGVLTPECFTERLHRGVFERVQALIEAGRPATPNAILPHVASVGLGGALAVDSSGRRNALTEGVAMRAGRRRSDRALRAVLPGSPGR